MTNHPSDTRSPDRPSDPEETSVDARRCPSDAEFLHLFKTRRDHYRALLEHSRRQDELIEADDYPQLLSVLGRKQWLLERLDELNKQHPHLRRQWQTRRGSLDPELRGDCEHLLAETEAFLAELLRTEKESTQRLTERRDATQKQLQAVSRGSEVHRAYAESLAPATHRHLDMDQ